MSCNVMLDQSESMYYRSDAASSSKLEYGQLVAWSLAYLVVGSVTVRATYIFQRCRRLAAAEQQSASAR
ncbi:MAG: hypothetical protein R3C53_13910 [Pirellulaceae bacterium]